MARGVSGRMPTGIRRHTGNQIEFAFAAGGVVVFALTVIFANRYLGWTGLGLPGADTRLFTDPAGDALRAGGDVYAVRLKGAEGFFWAPPWAVFFGAISWLPLQAQSLIMLAIETASLCYLAGSWRRLAYLGWCPLLPFALSSGNIHLLITASLFAAARGASAALALTTLAKLSPVLALRPRDWRPFAITMAVALLVTLPWLQLWPDWIAALGRAYRAGIGQQFPYLLRLPVALAIIAFVRRPWAGALSAVIAMPAFYPPISYVMLLAPLMVWARRNESAPTTGRIRRRSFCAHRTT